MDGAHLRGIVTGQILNLDLAIPGRPVGGRLDTSLMLLFFDIEIEVCRISTALVKGRMSLTFANSLDAVHRHLCCRVHPHNPQDVLGKRYYTSVSILL
jgi:hypothetical protein